VNINFLELGKSSSEFHKPAYGLSKVIIKRPGTAVSM